MRRDGLIEIAGHKNDGHEIKAQDIISFKNKLHYNAVCNILFKTTAEHKSQQQSKLHNMHMYNMLKCIKYYENIYLKLVIGKR